LEDRDVGEVYGENQRVLWNAAQPTVDVRDAAEALLLAERFGRIGERYIVSNEYLSYRELFGMVAAEGGQKPPIVMPLAIAYASAWLGDRLCRLARRKDHLIRSDAVYLSIAFGELESIKARKELTGGHLRWP